MPEIEYEGSRYLVGPDESVLNALLKNGVNAAHACKSGSCGSCVMRAATGVLPAKAQAGLKDSWKAQSYFLPCVCYPESDLRLTRVGSDAQLGAIIIGLELLSQDVLRVLLQCDSPFEFHAGQYVTILRNGPDDASLARSYSIACLPEGPQLELHVRKVAGGRMSGWFHEQARTGDRVSVLGPSGECFYVPGREDQPLLLVGTGTGLAPLYGILRDALCRGHRGRIHLFHGAQNRGGLYLVDELRRLAALYAHFEYTPTVLTATESDDAAVGPIDEVVQRFVSKLAGWRGYVCGNPSIVNLLRRSFSLPVWLRETSTRTRSCRRLKRDDSGKHGS